MRLEHVNLTVSDLERSSAFYQRLLGLDVRWRGHTTGGAPAIHIGDDRWYLALFEGVARDVPVEYERVGYNHLGIVVEDLDAKVAALEELGCPSHHVSDVPPGRRAYFFDPDGLEVELVEYGSAS